MESLGVLIAYIKAKYGGGGGVTVNPLSVSENGEYTAPDGEAYSPVTVNVPQPSGTKNITINANGTTTHDVEDYVSAQITVAVPAPTYPTWQGGSY